jgi:predicted Rossmann fold nucleotide-binding protein DprA/Smf involved in DNA uptake
MTWWEGRNTVDQEICDLSELYPNWLWNILSGPFLLYFLNLELVLKKCLMNE